MEARGRIRLDEASFEESCPLHAIRLEPKGSVDFSDEGSRGECEGAATLNFAFPRQLTPEEKRKWWTLIAFAGLEARASDENWRKLSE